MTLSICPIASMSLSRTLKTNLFPGLPVMTHLQKKSLRFPEIKQHLSLVILGISSYSISLSNLGFERPI